MLNDFNLVDGNCAWSEIIRSKTACYSPRLMPCLDIPIAGIKIGGKLVRMVEWTQMLWPAKALECDTKIGLLSSKHSPTPKLNKEYKPERKMKKKERKKPLIYLISMLIR